MTKPWQRWVCFLWLGGALTAAAAAALAPTAEGGFSAAQRGYWAFQLARRPAVPATESRWARGPIDAFLLAKLAAKGLEPSPGADKITLIRRASFDLIGLPPTPAEVADFLADDSPDAFAKLVDRLLESPHYGERWARHWLDLARFAESEGFKSDETRPNAWRYRDYVIRAFNQDKPYDRFVREQIAGDELWPDDPEARLATAFNRHFPDESNAANMMQRRQEILQDITDTTALTFMGLTVGCAKCHDHKFDPILQKDYYRLQAFFADTAVDDRIPMLTGEELADYNRRQAEWEARTWALRAAVKAILDPKRQAILDEQFERYPPELQAILRIPPVERNPFERQMYEKYLWQMHFRMSDEEVAGKLKGEEKERYEALRAELARYEDLNPGEAPLGVGLRDLGRQAPPTHVLTLANYAAPEEQVEPGFLSILDPRPADYSPPPRVESTGRRSALAEWLASPDNPLTPRVMVNRLWQHHFGRGIVATPSDFGLMGAQPTHPELLDWLAAEFVESGWSLKRMHRLIMNSAAYQQSSTFREEAGAKDPFNRLWWRFEPRRLDAEAVRDAALVASGLFNPEVGGPSVYPPLPAGMPEPRGGWDLSDDPADHYRRSIYVFVRRNSPYHMLKVMDMPDTHESAARREFTLTAPQALAYLNSEVTLGWAQALAGRALRAEPESASARLDRIHEWAFSRRADGAEKDAALTFLAKQRGLIAERLAGGEPIAEPTSPPPAGMDRAEAAAWVDLAHAVLNANEFVFQF